MKESGVHALLVTKGGEILLVKKGSDYQYDAKNAGKVALFGGGMEVGEDMFVALKRELSEELELDIENLEVKPLETYAKTLAMDGVDVEVHVFVVSGVDRGLLVLREGDAMIDGVAHDANREIIEGSADELLARSDITRITRLALQDFIKNQ